MSVEMKRPPLTTILLWIAGAVTLVLTGYGIFSGVAFPIQLSDGNKPLYDWRHRDLRRALVDMHSR